MKAFIIGAGASCGTFSCSHPVPLAKQFGSVLGRLNQEWERQYPALVNVIDHLQFDRNDWDLTPVWTCMDYYAKLQEAIPKAKEWDGGACQLKKALL